MAKRKKKVAPIYGSIDNPEGAVTVVGRKPDGSSYAEIMTRAESYLATNRRGKVFSVNGAERPFKNVNVFWSACVDYFEEVEKNPKYVAEVIKSGEKAGELIPVPKEVPFTLAGLALHLGISASTLARYRDWPDYSEFWEAMAQVDLEIERRNFVGAAIGIYNPNIMIRSLKLADTRIIEGDGEGTSVTNNTQVNNNIVVTGINVL